MRYLSLLLTVLFLMLTDCGGLASKPLFAGQWTAPVSIGGSRYFIQGFDIQAAMNGANSYCNQRGNPMIIDNVIPSETRNGVISVTFFCR